MRDYRKIFIPKANGFIYVEEYDKGEEENRCKIYDSNWEYLDYIDIEFKTEKEYRRIIFDLIEAETNVEFWEICGWNCFDCGHNLLGVAEDTFENEGVGYDDYDYCQKVIDQLHSDYDTMSEKDFCEQYEINRVGDWFAYKYN